MQQRPVPTYIMLTAAWLVVGGLISLYIGLQALDVAKLAGLLEIFTLGVLGGNPKMVLQILGGLLVASGVAMIPLAYFVHIADIRGRKYGIVAAGIAGMCLLAGALYVYTLINMVPSQLYTAFVAGVANLAAAWFLYRSRIAEDWFSGGWSDVVGVNVNVQQHWQPQPQHPSAPTTQLWRPQSSAWLINRTPGMPGNVQVPLQARHHIGRDAGECDILLQHPTASRRHAFITFEGGHYFVTDWGSTDGTFVNNRRVQKQMLHNNDQVRMGGEVWVFMEVQDRPQQQAMNQR